MKFTFGAAGEGLIYHYDSLDLGNCFKNAQNKDAKNVKDLKPKITKPTKQRTNAKKMKVVTITGKSSVADKVAPLDKNILSLVDACSMLDQVADDAIAKDCGLSEMDIKQKIQDKLVWRVQNNLSKQQHLAFGVVPKTLFEKWLLPQCDCKETTRMVPFNGCKEEVEFMHLHFFEKNLPTIINNTYGDKRWSCVDCRGKRKEYQGIIDHIHFIYNSRFEWLECTLYYHVLVDHPTLSWIGSS